jgi:hypothetical protein
MRFVLMRRGGCPRPHWFRGGDAPRVVGRRRRRLAQALLADEGPPYGDEGTAAQDGASGSTWLEARGRDA